MRPSVSPPYEPLAPHTGLAGGVGMLVMLRCSHCSFVTAVEQNWRVAHIGETHQCWNCNRWSDIPVLAPWERS